MGLQILFAALGLVGGSYYLLRALLCATDETITKAFGQALLGAAGILCGVAYGLSLATS